MNHKLMFESSWEKAISPVDRKTITEIYLNQPPVGNTITYTTIRAALNHYGALLAMVLIQNGTKDSFSIRNLDLQYEEEGRGVIAQHCFNLPKIIIEKHTSMPWTFVFPQDTIAQRPLLINWILADH
ncbi:SLAP domain-containing protein [Pseudalkalibacillus decolorationis]|uniref:SLAP domain-containing protein n=1 Tax=Pseudalkalibacillus decolorationis TaxID=163879 RepID=UPI0021481076|nr:SLAP domain-containing protein [Pseudalkalibacillus decolorationis]